MSITIRNAADVAFQGVEVLGAYSEGQFCVSSGYSTTNECPVAVSPPSSGLPLSAQLGSDSRAYPIFKYPIDDTDWEAMQVSGYTYTAGDRVLGIMGKGVVIEDDQLYYTVGTGVWRATATYIGQGLCVNASGFLTTHTGGVSGTGIINDPRAVIAELVQVDTTGGIVTYKLL